MALGKRRRERRRISEGVVLGNINNKEASMRVIGAQTSKKSPGLGVCPVCKEKVPLKMDGTVGSHKVGSSQRNSWRCPGTYELPVKEGENGNVV